MVNKIFKHLSSGLLLNLIFSLFVRAQASEVEMADEFRADGKIYVVVTTVLIVLIGLFLFLIYLDKKITKLEKLS